MGVQTLLRKVGSMPCGLRLYVLIQGSQTRGPPDVFVRPATSPKLLKLLVKITISFSIRVLSGSLLLSLFLSKSDPQM